MAGEVGVNVGTYKADKENGSARIVNIEGVLHYVQRRYHPETGKATPAFVPITLENLKKGRAELAANLEALDLVIADAEKAGQGPSV